MKSWRNFAAVFAATVFCWLSFATVRWLQSFANVSDAFHHFFSTCSQDWMTLLVLSDLAIFANLVIIYLVLDMRKRGLPHAQRVGWIAGTVLIGSPVFIFYLIRRKD